MNREAWKIVYRQLRIVRRETTKMAMDVMLYGTGYVMTGPEVPDLIQHIPIQEMRERAA